MRDISHKVNTLRIAKAQATLTVSPETVERVRSNNLPKKDPLTVARVAAIQAAKDTSRMIPYCHPLPIDSAAIEFTLAPTRIIVEATLKTLYKTGVEIEAMTAASVAALTLYDMLKMVDEQMEITQVRLLHKEGGKADFGITDNHALRAAVLVVSDSAATGLKADETGPLIVERLSENGLQVLNCRIVSDEPDEIQEALLTYADEEKADLVITTGGTGLGPRDNTPEATRAILHREAPGLTETLRRYGQERTPYAMLSRGLAGTRGTTLIINLPGSKNAVRESLDALFPAVLHAFKMMRGEGHAAERSLAVPQGATSA